PGLRPSLDSRRVGPRITPFGACTAVTNVTAARSPSRQNDPLHQKLPQLHYFRCPLYFYPAERSRFRVGLAPTVKQRLFAAHEKCGLVVVRGRRSRWWTRDCTTIDQGW